MALTERFVERVLDTIDNSVNYENSFVKGISECQDGVIAAFDNGADVKHYLQVAYTRYFHMDTEDLDPCDRAEAEAWEVALYAVLSEVPDLDYENCEKTLSRELAEAKAYLDGVVKAGAISSEKLTDFGIDSVDDYADTLGVIADGFETNYPRNGDPVKCRYFDGVDEMFQDILVLC